MARLITGKINAMKRQMTKYIALLRGVNVGGSNKIVMSELKAAFEKKGFKNVSTYINSGNVIFESESDETVVKTACERLIKTNFGLKITVGIITASELNDALANAPDWWNKIPNAKHNAIFVIPPMTPSAVCAEAGGINPKYENIGYYGKVIFWSAPLITFSRTRWSKISKSSKAYNAITIRNANTVLKLAELIKR